MMKARININGRNRKGFTFTEVMISLSLFMVLASVGMGAYFRYYTFSLINNDVGRITKILHDTRFKAMKNPYNSDYGLHLTTGTGELTAFRDTYTSGNPENETVSLEQLNITAISLSPNPGTTNDIVFDNMTGKTQNFGSFTVGAENFSYTFNINPQGVFE